MTKYATSPSLPVSNSVQTFGCVRRAAIFASRANRRRVSGSSPWRAPTTLIATSRSRRVSCARYTSPIPPAPIGARIS